MEQRLKLFWPLIRMQTGERQRTHNPRSSVGYAVPEDRSQRRGWTAVRNHLVCSGSAHASVAGATTRSAQNASLTVLLNTMYYPPIFNRFVKEPRRWGLPANDLSATCR